MKVKIGPYKEWIGPFQLADLITKIGFSEDQAYRLGGWLSDGYIEKFLNWMYSKRKRHISVKIDRYDTWGMYETMAVIIAPMLRQLRDTKVSYPLVSDKDVPPELRTRKKDYSNEKKDLAKWDYVLNEMIFAFETYEKRVLTNYDWEEQFQSGEIDMKWVETEYEGKTAFTMETGPNHTFHVDRESMDKYANRLQNGFALFGKYYLNLWD